MKRSGFVLAALFATASPSLVLADSFYGAGAAGINILTNSDITGSGIDTEADFGTGWAGSASLGYGFDNGVRIEAEIGHRDNDADGAGSAKAWNLMGNVMYDVATGSQFTPYIGLGIGAARVKYEDDFPVGGGTVNDTDIAFAYQAVAGVAAAVHEGIKLTLDYRYLGTTDSSFRTSAGTGIDAEYRNHSVMVGLRWTFGGSDRQAMSSPPPVAQAALPRPAATPAQTGQVMSREPRMAALVKEKEPEPPAARRGFLVFFDFDKADLTERARQVIERAAKSTAPGKAVRINLVGHADRAGPERYNMGLSVRRAIAVKLALMQLGITESEIVVAGKGETQPLVATRDGVKEPQNRRVEVVF